MTQRTPFGGPAAERATMYCRVSPVRTSMLGNVEGEILAELDRFAFQSRPERPAASHERRKLARELHDGVLQSLTGVALQLELVARLVDKDPQAARALLREAQDLVVDEQRELRAWIQSVSPAESASTAPRAELVAALEELCRRVSRWGPRVALSVSPTGALPRTLGTHVYRLVAEALSNVTRHARAQVAWVDVEILEYEVRLVVEDDGRGFPFRGLYDLDMLHATGQGPASLKERVASLDGELVLHSTLSGSRLEITLPVQAQSILFADTDPAPAYPT